MFGNTKVSTPKIQQNTALCFLLGLLDIKFYLVYLILPFILQILPLLWVVINCKRELFDLKRPKKSVIFFTLVFIFFLCWSYYSVWSIILGPMSKEDWGPGFVRGIGIILVQVAPLLITAPLAIWVGYRAKT